MKDRQDVLSSIKRYFRSHPIVAILGPRQCVKTTIAREFNKKQKKNFPQNYFDLERLANPILALRSLSELIIIDEIQGYPELFPILRVIVDEEKLNQKYLILGSASRDFINLNFGLLFLDQRYANKGM